MTLPLSLAVCDYDRTRAIFDGRATVEGCAITAVPLEPEEAFHRSFKFSGFDISEISLSSYIMTPRAETRTTSRYRPSCRGCSGTAESTFAPTAASSVRRT